MTSLFTKLQDNLHWVPGYADWRIKKAWRDIVQPKRIEHVYVAVCDHFEPYWKKADEGTARRRLMRWVDEYPMIADRNRDSDGRVLKWSFFYPEEEYHREDLDLLARLCDAGYGDVEIHLHHDNDTAENLRRTLLEYKRRLHEQHGLLRCDPVTGDIMYGFIHGNWALDNSRRDGRWCGVNNEIDILLETGCYADFTMPSAPSDTQTRKVNGLYWAVDDPVRPKSHDTGHDVRVGEEGTGLLMVQGPLNLAWYHRKWGILPRIENGNLIGELPINRRRVHNWINTAIHVLAAPEHVFVKLYTHGTQERNLVALFDRGTLGLMMELLREQVEDMGACLHFTSAWEMAQQVRALQANRPNPSRIAVAI